MNDLCGIMAVDPGVNTGWAYWEHGEPDIVPTNTGVIRAAIVEGDDDRQYRSLFQKFSDILMITDPTVVIIESTGFWKNSPRSRRSAAAGSLVKLTMICGGLCALSPAFRTVAPMTWKGNLPDDVLEKRILKLTGSSYREHEREAVGLGLYYAGML